MTVAAEAEKKAAADRAEAVRVAAEAAAQKEKIAAEAAAQAEKFRAEGLSAVYSAEATGKRAVNEASNTLSVEQTAMQVRLALIQALPQIIAQSVKPLENIDGIKILHVEGLNGGGLAANGDASGGGLADQAVSAALRLSQPGTADRRADEGARAPGRRSQRDDGRGAGRRDLRPNRRAEWQGESGQFCPARQFSSPIFSSNRGVSARHFLLAPTLLPLYKSILPRSPGRGRPVSPPNSQCLCNSSLRAVFPESNLQI